MAHKAPGEKVRILNGSAQPHLNYQFI